jgi:N-acetylmuramoyl-L-alanine amidase
LALDAARAYRLGDRGPAVAEIRARLSALALLGDHPGPHDFEDAVFDTDVDSAVRHFQQERGATADGLVGPITWQLLDEARWRLGDRVLTYSVSHLICGDDVAALQRKLLELGFDSGREDGIFGRQTAGALTAFQRESGLVADGVCGPSTYRALARLGRAVVGGQPQALREAEAIRSGGGTLAGRVLVIDAGHGGSDRGSVAHGLEEAAVAEDLAARIEGRLAVLGARAYLTRGPLPAGASAPTEAERADFANEANADLVVSLHIDRAPSPRANGVAAYHYGNRLTGSRSAEGERLADLLRREVTARTDLLDCGVHAKTWDLLRRTRMPAVRLECGYLTHAGDAARLADPSFRDTLAEAVVAGIERLFATAGAPAGVDDGGPRTGEIPLLDVAALLAPRG